MELADVDEHEAEIHIFVDTSDRLIRSFWFHAVALNSILNQPAIPL
jgi:hypothetical protein